MLSTPFLLRRAVPALAAVLLAAPSLHAAEPWDGPAFAADPAALFRAASDLPGEPEGGIDMILLETVYSFDDAGRQTYTQRMVYRFTDGSAHESWSALEQSWSPWHQDRPVLKARVLTQDGIGANGIEEHRLDPATITENAESQSSPEMFEDGRVLRAPLPATGAGAVVEEEITVRETAPFFEGGTVDFANLQMAVPVRHVRLVLDAPAGLPLRWVARRLPGMSPTEQVAGGRRRLTFAVDDLEEYEELEAGLPPEMPRMAYVAFSSGQSWGDLARRYSDIVDRTVRGADLSAFLRSAGTESAGSQLETINALLRKLGKEIRYTGIELAEGGLIPRPPGETLKRKFGDCKDKAVVLTALLRSLDIPAYVALLNAGEGDPDVEEALPGMGAFNHAIVMVPGSPAIWIDPTDPFSRAGELPVQDQGRLALVASPTATGLVRTPEATSADNREVETREIYLSDLGPARVVETTEYWGAEENDLRSSYAAASEEDLEEALEGYVSETYLADTLTGLEHTEPDDLSRPFRLRLEMPDASRGTTDVRDAAVAVFLSTFTDRLPDEITGVSEDEEAEETGPRRNDYVFTRPFQVEVRYRIVPPAGFTPRPLPAYRSRQLGPAKLEEAYSVDSGGVVDVTLRFDTGKKRISPAEFEALRTGVQQIAEEKPILIAFDQVGETHLAAGRVREALDEFRRLAGLAPKKALPRTRIARALLAGGLGEAAREEAEQAVKIEPDLANAAAYAWVTLGWIRQHDDLGRRFGTGYDRAGAIAAYRKAKELDATNTEARADLAILLEHDANGERYGPDSDLAAAIEEYIGIEDALGDLGLSNNLVIALMWARRFDEMKARLDAMDGADGRAALKLVALAAIEGTDSALRSAERTFADGSARSEALSGAGRNLMLLRRYPEAATLFEAAGRQSSNAAALLGMAELLRKAKRHEELTFAQKDPASTVRRLSTLAAGSTAGKDDGERYSGLISREMTGDLAGPEARKAFWDGFESGFNEARRAARAANLPLSVAMDLGLAVLRPTVSGDDAVGYRVVMTSSVADRIRNVAFLIPEDGEYRIAATGKALATVGKEALRRIDRNDLKGARQWLDWAYDEEVTRKGTDPEPSPFLDLWSRGAEVDAEQTRCAAASLMAWDDMPSSTLPILTACRQAAAEGPRQAVFDRALLSAYRGLGQDSEAAETAGRLQEAAPDSVFVYGARVAALMRLQRWDDARRAAEARLARIPDDLAAQRTLVDLALRQGDFDAAESILQRAADSGRADADIYNEMAWIQLFRGKVDDRTVELAQRAATLSGFKSYGVLHTLAALYAEQGKTAEAYRLILQALDVKGGEPGDSDWYVFGRLAESYGLPDAARRCYEKARPGTDEPSPVSSIHLVRRRLEALGAKPEPKRVASKPARP